MSTKTAIEWTDVTWSPVVGCTQITPGCARCYAKTLHDMRHRAYQQGKLQNIPQYAQPFEVVQLLEQRLEEPLHWRTPRMVFVNSQADLFHDDIPDVYIQRVFAVMARAERHTFQVLTKRPQRMLNWFMRRALVDTIEELSDAARGRWPLPNVWLGVSVENQRWADERIPLLLQTPAAVRFLSCEPLLGPITFSRLHQFCPEHDFPGGFCTEWHPGVRFVDWVIAGGESGKGARPCELDWLRSLRDQCTAAGVAYFLKQLGGERDKRGGDAAVLDGERWTQMPEVAR